MPTPISSQIVQQTILNLLEKRGPQKSICPSEAARQLAPENWRPLMEAVRQEAKVLASRGLIKITQGDQTLNPKQEIKGFIRLRLDGAKP